jgi:hypothetical protein
MNTLDFKVSWFYIQNQEGLFLALAASEKFVGQYQARVKVVG